MAMLDYAGLDWRIAFTAVGLLVLFSVEIFALIIPQGKRFLWVSLVSCASIFAGLWVENEVLKTAFFDLAALILVPLIWSQNKKAGQYFLSAVLVGSVLVAAGMALGGFFGSNFTQPDGIAAKVVISLILVGYAIKLAMIPFSYWLAPVSEKSNAMTVVMVISLLDMAEFGELIALRIDAPWIFGNIQWIWIALALISMFGGALLALSQTNVRRMLAYSTIDDIGYLILGLAAGTVGGVLGAAIGALSHSLCKFLLFGAVGVAEKDLKHPLTLEDKGMSKKYPVAGAAFIAGALGMIGVPPLMGFLGRWRLYFSGIEIGGWILGVAMAVATALALFYYVRAIHKVWLGNGENEKAKAVYKVNGIDAIFIIMIILLIFVCLFPALLPGLAGR